MLGRPTIEAGFGRWDAWIRLAFFALIVDYVGVLIESRLSVLHRVQEIGNHLLPTPVTIMGVIVPGDHVE